MSEKTTQSKPGKKKTSSKKSVKSENISFEQAMSELEALVDNMEKGEQSLETSLKDFERGVELTRICQSALKQAEQKVQILSKNMGRESLEPFDEEGVPPRKTTVIDKGILKNYLMDTYAARKLKMRSTGNASGPNNMYLIAGKSSPDEIIKSVDKGLLLTGTIGQGLVPTTGDISRGAFGMWIENGEVTFPVAEITISGNLGQILREIEMVGNDLEYKRSINGPTIKIKEMTVGGI